MVGDREDSYSLEKEVKSTAEAGKNWIEIKIPEKARQVLETIHAAGYEAYVVGGCVRDSVLGRNPQDWDITTSARPEQVKALFRRTIDTGIQHGTVTVMLEKEGFEVTTYRIDGKYEDSRHPSEVTFTPNLEEDLKRRDFTINAMAYNDRDGLVDLFGGLEDIRKKRIRCVGDPEARFGEDALRILRAVRFAAQLGYEIEDSTAEAIRKLAPSLKKISAERIAAELIKLLVSDHPEELKNAYEMGITAVILPEFDCCMETPQNHLHHMYSVGEHILASVKEIKPDKVLRLTMLFHDIGKAETLTVGEDGVTHFYGHPEVSERIARDVLKRLKLDNDTIGMVCRLVRYHDYMNGRKRDLRAVRKAIYRIGEEAFPAIFDVWRADTLAQSMYQREEKLQNLNAWKELYEEVMKSGQCVSLKTLAITGNDLIALGMTPGKEVGEMLKNLLDLVLENPEKNTKEYLTEYAGGMIARS